MSNLISVITPEVVANSMNYAQYRELIDQLLVENKTTGEDHSERMLDFTRLNIQRMKRWDKTAKISEEAVHLVKLIDRKQIWLVITEGWCGDAAQIVPYFEKLASYTDGIEVRYILRDQNLAVMDEYLTNGGRSIPKLIALDAEDLEEMFEWGPRPKELQEMILDHKRDPKGVSSEEFKKKIHLWYAKDKNKALEQEIVALLS
ncbi:thioredoxin family protein [Echinicola shivajiensis]|uniref:thioredoxin family protein n=1 Tax=Echinicola shivajiensis TaxID=1035916 RepID=UPI001BFCCCBF|nr:thioredoxin family protein [Echinicola shivajiensis]